MRQLRVFGFFFLIVFCGWELYQRQKISLYIEGCSEIRLPRRDIKRLDWFFRKYCILDDILYTLAGQKPLTLIGHYLTLKDFDVFYYFHNWYSTEKFLLGWKTWKKHSHLFANARFIFLEEQPLLQKKEFLQIILADREQIVQIIKNHEKDFLEGLKRNVIHPEDLLNEWVENGLFTTANHALVGILLGYGRGNAFLFQERTVQKRERLPCVWEKEVMTNWAKRFGRKFITFDPYEIEDLTMPSFAGNPDSEESRALKKKYLETRDLLLSFYQGKPFLETTLSLFKRGPEILYKNQPE